MQFRRKNNLYLDLFIFSKWSTLENRLKEAKNTSTKNTEQISFGARTLIYTDASYSELGLRYTQMLLIPVQTYVTLTLGTELVGR